MTEAFLLALLDLFNNLLTSFSGCNFSLNFAITLCLNVLKTLNLHHGVEALLLIYPFLFKLLVLLNLSIADGEDFRIEHQSVKTFNVVFIFVELFLSLGKHS